MGEKTREFHMNFFRWLERSLRVEGNCTDNDDSPPSYDEVIGPSDSTDSTDSTSIDGTVNDRIRLTNNGQRNETNNHEFIIQKIRKRKWWILLIIVLVLIVGLAVGLAIGLSVSSTTTITSTKAVL